MAIPTVHWQEGMFLRAHHFQTLDRQWTAMSHRASSWDNHFHWGLRSIEIDPVALSNYRFVVRSLKARFRDGTMVAWPDDGPPPALDLKGAFERSPFVTVYLAVPLLHLGKANVATDGGGSGARYLLDTQKIEDENTGVNVQSVTLRRLNVRLLLSADEHSGYEVLPIARIEKSSKAEAPPQLDLTYIPPILACDAWRPLADGILQSIYDRIGKKIELLANQVVSRGITFDSKTQGDTLLFEQLRELNEVYAYFGVMMFVEGVSPLAAYLELCRLVGKLAIFGAERRPLELPKYDHDDLGTCFYRVKQYIDALLDIVVEPIYKERTFVGAGLRMQVSLEPAWLESVWQMYLGVKSELDTEECIRLLTRAGELDMKVGSSERVDAIFRLGLAGLRFTHAPRPPRALPVIPGLIYFQINRESQQEEWRNVEKSLTLAIRVNENLIAGNIQGQRVLVIKTVGTTTTLEFTLFVVPQAALALG
ncbi:MAG: type VI secretion system baseplate subunit TssK [Planctomycetota bacterium]